MRVAFILSDAVSDRAALAAARHLRQGHHDVTLVVPQTESRPVTPAFTATWQAEGFAWLPVSAARLTPASAHFPRDPSLATARTLSEVLQSFDAALFFESHWAMPTLRDRRFRDRLLPLVVLTEESSPTPLPDSLEAINRASSSEYARQHADLVIGNPQELNQLESLFQQRRAAPARPIRPALTSPAVTVCIPHFEAPEFLPLTLESLERQSSADFTVIVVDDGSPSPEARAVFAACAQRYAPRGWKFLTQTNQFPGAARNHAARQASTEFLLFLDADDLATPAMVERFLRAALLTGDDCLVVPNYGVESNDPTNACRLLYEPPGSLIGSIGDDMHGGSCIFVRREAFWQIGGFTELRGVGFEDYEFHVRCQLAGLRWDVLPEFLYRYRMPREGGVSRSTVQYANHARVLDHYAAKLIPAGLEQLPLALASTYWRLERTQQETEEQQRVLRRKLERKPRQLRLLLLTCFFPYGMTSGWHQRVQAMIRYFGSRYSLTLVTQMTREELAPVRRETFRHLRFLRGVEGSNLSAASDPSLPLRVKETCTDTLRGALQSMPTSHYHAALIDQIFLAELRQDIETVTVLTEHNIESRLMHQAAQHAGHPLREALLMEQYEDRVWPQFPLRAVVSETDRAQIAARTRQGKTVVAANGADPSAWLPHVRHHAATVLFPAHLAYLPNVDAVELLLTRIWPLVRKRNPQAKLILAGRDPAPAVKAAASQAKGVELCVNPPSMQRLAARASLTVAPLRLGSGTRCKILESMAWGLPVVSTTLGAEGIDAADGEHLLIRDQPEAFAEAILQLLADEALWRKLRHSGHALVRERYSWDHVFAPLEDALLNLIS